MTIKLKGSFGPITGAMNVGDVQSSSPINPVTSGLYAGWDATESEKHTITNGKITKWGSSNPNVWAETQVANEGASITSQNGQQAISMDNRMFISDSSATTFTQYTVLITAIVGTSTHPIRLGADGNTRYTYAGLEIQQGNNSVDWISGYGNNKRGTATGIGTGFHKWSITQNNNVHTAVIYDNNIQPTLSNIGSNDNVNLKLGTISYSGANQGSFYEGSVICEVLFYNRILTAQELTDTNNYMTTKWG